MFRSLTSRLVAIAVLQMVLLAVIAVVIWWFTAPHAPPGPSHPLRPSGPPPGLPFGPLLTLACALVVLAIGAFATARWIVRPIERLSRALHAFGAGNLRVRSELVRGDELGELAKRFDEMAARIEALLATEKELMANVAHELRTPLARIGVALDLATEGNSERARASLSEIAVDVAELETIVNDIFTALRVETSGVSALALRRVPQPPADIANEAAQRMRSRHPDRPLDVAVAADVPDIEVDRVLFRRVIDNLLENAHKYTPERDAPIRLSAARTDETIVFEIADRGVGISPDELPHVFEPFWRSERSRSRAAGGVGLGLTLVKRIVEAHGGDIALTSALGAGTVARITVPLALESSITGIGAIRAGLRHTCMRVADGTLRCVGRNESGPLGNDTSTSSPSPVSPLDLDAVTTFDGADEFTCAIVAADDGVHCWGRNTEGELGDGSGITQLRPVYTQLATGGDLVGASDLAVGGRHACALAGGTAYCWGANNVGQVGDGMGGAGVIAPTAVEVLANVSAIAAGVAHTCAVLADGSVRCWGINDSGEVGDGNGNGTAVSPTAVLGLPSRAVAIHAGRSHTCAILDDGAPYCWGKNSIGQIANPVTSELDAPILVDDLGTPGRVATGGDNTCTIAGDLVLCCGSNSSGQLATGTIDQDPHPLPTAIPLSCS